MRMLDLFCGRFGWSKAFAERGWEVVGVDLRRPAEVPKGCLHIRCDVMQLDVEDDGYFFAHGIDGKWFEEKFDFVCASSPCEQFSVHGLRCFHPDPPYPEGGLRLFNHTRMLCERSGASYVMENVRSAQKFVGNAAGHCGPFYLWGNAVPPIFPQGILKGRRLKTGGYRTQTGLNLKEAASVVATIPPELANCVADYAERLLEMQVA